MKKLIYFSSVTCTPCKMFGPIMDRVSQSGIPVEKIDVDKAPAVAAAYNVRSIPTVVLVDPQGQEITRFVGVKPENLVRELYNQN
jgi:thioredoxin-like negative regulator of GroEL